MILVDARRHANAFLRRGPWGFSMGRAHLCMFGCDFQARLAPASQNGLILDFWFSARLTPGRSGSGGAAARVFLAVVVQVALVVLLFFSSDDNARYGVRLRNSRRYSIVCGY